MRTRSSEATSTRWLEIPDQAKQCCTERRRHSWSGSLDSIDELPPLGSFPRRGVVEALERGLRVGPEDEEPRLDADGAAVPDGSDERPWAPWPHPEESGFKGLGPRRFGSRRVCEEIIADGG